MNSTLAFLTPCFTVNSDNRSERERLNAVVLAHAFQIAARPVYLTRKNCKLFKFCAVAVPKLLKGFGLATSYPV